MIDATEWILGALAIVLGGAAFAVGGQVIREAWRGVFRTSRSAAWKPVTRGDRPGADIAPRLLRGIAGFEAVKGLLALAAVLGLLGLVHHDLHRAAATLIGHIGLRPGDHYPAVALGELDKWLAADRRPLLLAAAGYIVLRFTEAYGLWHARPWGERLGAWSGALYLPFEWQHLIHRPGAVPALVLLANLAVVGFLVWRLRSRVNATAPRQGALR
jgi:uncharacterized membrane protein (DUF2068 family)